MLCLGLGGLMLWTRHHVFAAEQALSRHDYSGAVEHLAPCLKIWSDDARLHFLAARAERCAKHYDMAEKHLRVCTRQQWPEDQITLERLLAQMQLGDSSGERYLWSRIEADDPDKSWILEVLIQEYVQTYRLLDALKALNLFLEDRPDDVQALLGRAFVFERLFYHADAVLDYRQALRLEPENETIRFRLAKELLVTGPIQEAAEHFEHLLHWQTGVQLHLARARREL